MSNLYEDMLISDPPALFREADQDSDDRIDKLLESQLARLKNRGCPPQITETLLSRKRQVLRRLRKKRVTRGKIPFLPVIPRTYLDLLDLMSMVRHEDKTGYTYLKPFMITDVIETPDEPYYIFDVDFGDILQGKSPLDAERIVKAERSRCLTVFEVIALAVHSDVLSHQYLWATGSRSDPDGVPYLWLCEGRPKLSRTHGGRSHADWATPFCSK